MRSLEQNDIKRAKKGMNALPHRHKAQLFPSVCNDGENECGGVSLRSEKPIVPKSRTTEPGPALYEIKTCLKRAIRTAAQDFRK